MKIQCRTNLDLRHEKWPSELPTLPRVGDYIESATTWGHFRLYLEVISVKWACYKGEWVPIVELHIPRHRQWSIYDFYKWYAPLVGKSVHAFI